MDLDFDEATYYPSSEVNGRWAAARVNVEGLGESSNGKETQAGNAG